MTEFSPGVIAKARTLIDRGRVSRDSKGRPGMYFVQSSATLPYRVLTDADTDARTATWITCTCTHGLHNPGIATCSHAVAVLVAVRDRLDLPRTEPEDYTDGTK